MSYIRIDSYGSCLKNIHMQERKQSNSALYSSYKFVIAIENSNCEDYVTEKFIDALSSTSIPIVAGRNGKPDYLRFTPKHSYINVYDYKSIKDLADYLNYSSKNETAYNEYLWFRESATNENIVTNILLILIKQENNIRGQIHMHGNHLNYFYHSEFNLNDNHSNLRL